MDRWPFFSDSVLKEREALIQHTKLAQGLEGHQRVLAECEIYHLWTGNGQRWNKGIKERDTGHLFLFSFCLWSPCSYNSVSRTHSLYCLRPNIAVKSHPRWDKWKHRSVKSVPNERLRRLIQSTPQQLERSTNVTNPQDIYNYIDPPPDLWTQIILKKSCPSLTSPS